MKQAVSLTANNNWRNVLYKDISGTIYWEWFGKM